MEDQTAMTVVASPPTRKASKKRGPMSFLRAAMVVVRRGSSKKPPVAVEVASNAMKLVGSMRPLHLRESSSPPPQPTLRVSVSMDSFLDVDQPPTSPSAASSSGSSTSDGLSSRFASAQNLQELDHPDIDDVWAEDGGDEMIDVKAKEFIAQFYERMRLERLDSVKRASQ